MKIFIAFLALVFSLVFQSTHCNGQSIDDSMYITRQEGVQDFFLHYSYKGVKKQIALKNPFRGLPYLTGNIMYIIDSNAFQEKSNLRFDNILIVCTADSSHGKNIMLHFIDMNQNKPILIFSKGVGISIDLLLTEFPYFVMFNDTPDKSTSLEQLPATTPIIQLYVVACSAFKYTEIGQENATWDYYAITPKSVTQTTTQKIVTPKEEGLFKESFNRYGTLLKHLFPGVK